MTGILIFCIKWALLYFLYSILHVCGVEKIFVYMIFAYFLTDCFWIYELRQLVKNEGNLK